MRKNIETPRFTISLSKGLADRHRLPWEHVIRTLQEFGDLLRDVGQQVQRDKGVDNPTGDFGIELLANRGGFVFSKGSLKAVAAITRDTQNGVIAVTRVIHAANMLERKKPETIDPSYAPILRRFARISGLQRQDRTELKIKLQEPGKRTKQAIFGETAIATIESLSAAGLTLENITAYGKLRELKDRSREEEGGDTFWGELIAENGEIWRVQFSTAKLNTVLPLFRRQVVITGDATYFKANNPRLIAKSVDLDPERDYEKAFDTLRQSYRDDLGDADVVDLLKEIRG